MVISGLTLSLFEDMGWYNVNRSQAEYYGWGKGLGCSFIQSKCEISWPNFTSYWCSSTSNGCTGDRLGKGKCAVVTYGTALANKYQHFTNTKVRLF